MGTTELFTKRAKSEVIRTKILVASLDPKFAALVETDRNCYSQFYPNRAESVLESVPEPLETIDKRYDIVHLFCDVSLEGSIVDGYGHRAEAALLIQRCCDWRCEVTLVG